MDPKLNDLNLYFHLIQPDVTCDAVYRTLILLSYVMNVPNIVNLGAISYIFTIKISHK